MSKNIPASVMGRLKNIARELNIAYNLVLQLYVQERLLYRISQSSYKNNFILKGGLLLYSMDEFKGRPTKDIDFLLKDQSNDSQNIEQLIKEIIEIEAEDGVLFKTDQIKSNSIIEGADYKGQRIKIIGLIGKAEIHLQIDIGFGDPVIPEPVKIKYPGLLDFKEPEIIAYSLETVIAEKFNAMASLALLNSRMKDFYDIFSLMRRKKYDAEILKKSIEKTFKNRNTELDENLIIFSDRFKKDPAKIKQWNLFLNRIAGKDLSFSDVVTDIELFLKPIYNAVVKNQQINSSWDPDKLKWS